MATAQELGRLLAQRDIGLVYGGATVGTMGAVADAALADGGQVIGVIPDSLVDHELAHQGLTELITVRSMLERKDRMIALSDGFITLPGGAGTLDELFEVFTWSILDYIQKPCVLLNLAGYYDRLLGFLDHAIEQGFVDRKHRELVIVTDSPESAIDALGFA